MSSDQEMRRLILHAADVLATQSGLTQLKTAVANESYTSKRLELANELARAAAAMALAEGTLRMVAACMAVDAPERDERGRFIQTKEVSS